MRHLNSVEKRIALVPALAVFVLLALLPVVNLFITSFYDVSWTSGAKELQWVGLGNYAAIGDDPLFKAGLVNTCLLYTSPSPRDA